MHAWGSLIAGSAAVAERRTPAESWPPMSSTS